MNYIPLSLSKRESEGPLTSILGLLIHPERSSPKITIILSGRRSVAKPVAEGSFDCVRRYTAHSTLDDEWNLLATDMYPLSGYSSVDFGKQGRQDIDYYSYFDVQIHYSNWQI